jgi:hypothetical protein
MTPGMTKDALIAALFFHYHTAFAFEVPAKRLLTLLSHFPSRLPYSQP